MKNLRMVWLILMVSFGLLVTCEKNSKPQKYFKVDGKTYPIDRGFYIDWGSNDNGS